MLIFGGRSNLGSSLLFPPHLRPNLQAVPGMPVESQARSKLPRLYPAQGDHQDLSYMQGL